MHARLLRAGIVLLGIALVWGLPIPSGYVGGIGNYDVWSWGLYGWVRIYTLQSGFRFGSRNPVQLVYTLGLVLTVAASVLMAIFGSLWVRGWRGSVRTQRVAGLLVFLTPAVLLVIELWWPDIYGGSGGGGNSYQYHRGYFGYLREAPPRFSPPDLPPCVGEITGTLALDPMGLMLTGLASVVVVAVAGWLGSKISRLGLPR